MRMIFSFVGLLVVLAVVSILAKKQLTSVTTLPVVPQATSTDTNSAAASSSNSPVNSREQSQQIQQQVQEQLKQAMDAAAQTRAGVDEK